jgi:hypothetical protein
VRPLPSAPGVPALTTPTTTALAAGTAATVSVHSAALVTAGAHGLLNLQAPGPQVPGHPGGAAATVPLALGLAGRLRAGRAMRLGLRGVGARLALLPAPLSLPR